MRIALVTHQFFPEYYTGVERLTLNLAKQLGRMGHECCIVTAAEQSSGDESPYGYHGVHVRPVARHAPADLAQPWADSNDLAVRIGRVLDEEQVELVHVLQPVRLPLVFEEAALRDLPVVAHVPDFTYFCARVNLLRPDGSSCVDAERGLACTRICRIPNGTGRFAWGLSRLDGAAAVVSPCRATIQLHADQGFRVDHWHYIPWGVDYSIHPTRLPPPGGDGLVIGFIGTLLRHKGPHTVIEAVRKLPGADLRLILYGDSFHEAGYERELRKLAGGDPRIQFAGRYEHADFPSVLAPLDAVVIPSEWHENLPSTGLNAVAAGVPLVVSDVPGLSELVDDYDCGFTFAAGDAADLAGLLERLLDNGGLLRQTRARMTYPIGVEEEAWRLEAIYEQALSRPSLGDRSALGVSP